MRRVASGAGIATALSKEGAAVVAVDVLREKLEAVVVAIPSGWLYSKCRGRKHIDIGRKIRLPSVVHFASMDVWIVSWRTPAVQRFAKLADTTDEIWDEVQGVNLRGVYLELPERPFRK